MQNYYCLDFEFYKIGNNLFTLITPLDTLLYTLFIMILAKYISITPY